MSEKGRGSENNGAGLLNGKYELGRILGHGSFAKVYHARNLQNGKSVAMKVVGKEKVMQQVGMMEQVKREISVMKMVKHPNIVNLYEVMASKSKIYFAMELVRGGELFEKVAKGRLREDTVIRIKYKYGPLQAAFTLASLDSGSPFPGRPLRVGSQREHQCYGHKPKEELTTKD